MMTNIQKMSAIICECNPLHEGHLRLMNKAKENGNLLLMIMSGCFTQRGQIAIASPYDRASQLLACGADIVVQLPLPFSISSADYFAKGGVYIAESLHSDELWFGSECGDISLLTSFANATKSQIFDNFYQKEIQKRNGTTSAYIKTLQSIAKTSYEPSSNDLLAVNYLRYCKTTTPKTMLRQGADYHSTSMEDIPSSTGLRALLKNNQIDTFLHNVPDQVRMSWDSLLNSHKAPYSEEKFQEFALTYFRLFDLCQTADIVDSDEGILRRLKIEANRSTSYDEWIENVSSKQYPKARIQRNILYTILGVRKSDLQTMPSYVRLLSASTRGKAYIKSIKDFSIVTCQKNIPESGLRQSELESKEISLFTSFANQSTSPSAFYQQKPIIL